MIFRYAVDAVLMILPRFVCATESFVLLFHAAILADEMGLGKTIQVVELCSLLFFTSLNFCLDFSVHKLKTAMLLFLTGYNIFNLAETLGR